MSVGVSATVDGRRLTVNRSGVAVVRVNRSESAPDRTKFLR